MGRRPSRSGGRPPLWGLHLRIALGLMHDNQASSLDGRDELPQPVATDSANLLVFLNTL